MADPEDIYDAEIIPMPGIDLGAPRMPDPEDDPSDLERWEPAPLDRYAAPDPTLPTAKVSIVDVKLIPTRSTVRQWLDECRGGIEYRARKWWVHGTRVPLYAGRTARHAGRGVRVTAGFWWSWVRDQESLLLRRVLADDTLTRAADPVVAAKRYQEAYEARSRRVRIRWAVTVLLLAAAGYGWYWLWIGRPVLAALAMAVVVLCLGVIGAQRGDIVQVVDDPGMVLTAETLVAAFQEAKLTKLTPVTVVGVPYETGGGWAAKVRLPPGVTFDEVIRAQLSLASALDCPRDSLDLDPLPMESERLIGVFVASEHPTLVDVPRWPLLDVDRWDVWRPIPVGWDTRGRPVMQQVLWLHTLVGASPQRGKSTVARLFALAVLLDPRASLIVVDFKGGTDWVSYRQWCDRFILGGGDEQIAEFAALLGWLEEERARRMAVIAEMPSGKVPQGRVTPAMAETARFKPIVVIVDEFQVATESPAGKKIIDSWSQLARLCPAAAISIVAITQNPNKESCPTRLRNIMLQRLALSVPTYQASVAVLGDEAYQLGLNAAAIGGQPGVGIMWAQDSPEGPGFRGRLRIPDCTPEMADQILQRVARVRKPRPEVSAGTGPVAGVVVDALAVWPRPAMNCHQDVLARELGLSAAELGQALRDAGIPAEPVRMARDGGSPVRRGYRLVDLEAAAR